MATWRRKALILFPMLAEDLNDREYSIYSLYFDLLPMSREAHDRKDDAFLESIYGYAEWCLSQQTKDLWNAAGVAFYEHLFDCRKHWKRVVPWLSPTVIDECWPLWEARLESGEVEDIRKLIETRKSHRYRALGE
jgi:hypothetical protein